jgi:hypothetical protein
MNYDIICKIKKWQEIKISIINLSFLARDIKREIYVGYMIRKRGKYDVTSDKTPDQVFCLLNY